MHTRRVKLIARLRARAERGDAKAAAKLAEELLDRPRTPSASRVREAKQLVVTALEHLEPGEADDAARLFLWRDYEEPWNPRPRPGVDPEFAVGLLRKLARRGNAQAMYSLCMAQTQGVGAKRDLADAERWARRAARHGEPEALNNLGVVYFYGEGVERDVRHAVRCYSEAAHCGDAFATWNLALCYRWGDGVAKNLREFRRLTRRAAKLGSVRAKLRLIDAAFDGREGFRRDPRGAKAALRKLVASGSTLARVEWARRQLFGDGVRKDARAALSSLRSLARREEPGAAFWIAMHFHESSTKSSAKFAKAEAWLEIGVAAGDSFAMHLLSMCLREGHGNALRRNVRRANELLQRAAELGDSEAQLELGRRLCDGDGIRRDVRRGLELLARHAD